MGIGALKFCIDNGASTKILSNLIYEKNLQDWHCPKIEQSSFVCKRSEESDHEAVSSESLPHDIQRSADIPSAGLLMLVNLLFRWMSSFCWLTDCPNNPIVGFDRAEGQRDLSYYLTNRDKPRSVKNKWWVSTFIWDGDCRRVETQSSCKDHYTPSHLLCCPSRPPHLSKQGHDRLVSLVTMSGIDTNGARWASVLVAEYALKHPRKQVVESDSDSG